MNLEKLAQALRDVADALDESAPVAEVKQEIAPPKAEVVQHPSTPPQAPETDFLSLYGGGGPAEPETQVVDQTPSPAAPTKQDVIDVFMAVTSTRGATAVTDILARNGLTRLSEANDSQIAQLHADGVEALSG